MKQELKDLLTEYYGELQQRFDNSNGYFERRSLNSRMNAINRLLEVPQVEMKGSLKEIIKELNK